MRLLLLILVLFMIGSLAYDHWGQKERFIEAEKEWALSGYDCDQLSQLKKKYNLYHSDITKLKENHECNN